MPNLRVTTDSRGAILLASVLFVLQITFLGNSVRAESEPWTYDNDMSFADAAAVGCNSDVANDECLFVYCRGATLSLGYFYTGGNAKAESRPGAPLRAEIEVGHRQFRLPLHPQPVGSDFGGVLFAAQLDESSPLLDALMTGRLVSVTSNMTKPTQFSLRGSSQAIGRVQRECTRDSRRRESTNRAGTRNEAGMLTEATNGRFTRARGHHIDDCGERVEYEAEFVDLNRDGQPEILLHILSSCMAGNTGTWFELYAKSSRNRWERHFGMPGIPNVLMTSHRGYADIEIGGPGLCFPIYHWNGHRYVARQGCP